MYSLKKSTENRQKLLNFGKQTARFDSVLKAKSSARQKVGLDPTLLASEQALSSKVLPAYFLSANLLQFSSCCFAVDSSRLMILKLTYLLFTSVESEPSRAFCSQNRAKPSFRFLKIEQFLTVFSSIIQRISLFNNENMFLLISCGLYL